MGNICNYFTNKILQTKFIQHSFQGHSKSNSANISFSPIGIIRTAFSDKRAVPRQANVASKLISRIDLCPTVFNNPEHSVEGLENFSHIWIIYYFHRNQAHLKAKVAPPRLGGERVGVFSTRSPHRPCPIGLSLVELERIENSSIYFYGTDMVMIKYIIQTISINKTYFLYRLTKLPCWILSPIYLSMTFQEK